MALRMVRARTSAGRRQSRRTCSAPATRPLVDRPGPALLAPSRSRRTSTGRSMSSPCRTSLGVTCWPTSAARVGERYILGNRNFTMTRLFADLGRLSGVQPPALKLPVTAAMTLAAAAQRLGQTGLPTPVEVRAASLNWSFSNRKAKRELGWRTSPARGLPGGDDRVLPPPGRATRWRRRGRCSRMALRVRRRRAAAPSVLSGARRRPRRAPARRHRQRPGPPRRGRRARRARRHACRGEQGQASARTHGTLTSMKTSAWVFAGQVEGDVAGLHQGAPRPRRSRSARRSGAAWALSASQLTIANRHGSE